jgi:hypothetical protein
MVTVAVAVIVFIASGILSVRMNRRMKNRNTSYHRGAQMAAIDHLVFGSPSSKARGHGRFRFGYRRYAGLVRNVRAQAHKVAIKDAERLLREHRLAVSVAGSAGASAMTGAGLQVPDAIARQVDLSGGIDWPSWVRTEVENLGYGGLDRTPVEADRKARLDKLFADAALGRTRRWLRYESPVEHHSGAVEVIHRVQISTIELLRRHAALVADARGWAPQPPPSPVTDFDHAVRRAAAWLRTYGYFAAEATWEDVVQIRAEGMVAAVVAEPVGYRMSASDLHPLVGAASDQLAVLVVFDTHSLDPLLVAQADDLGVALFTLSTSGEMTAHTRPAVALAARPGGTERVPWPIV